MPFDPNKTFYLKAKFPKNWQGGLADWVLYLAQEIHAGKPDGKGYTIYQEGTRNMGFRVKLATRAFPTTLECTTDDELSFDYKVEGNSAAPAAPRGGGSAALKQAEDLQDEILEAIEAVSDRARNACDEFLESVEMKAASIVETVRGSGVLTTRQEQTLANMLAGVKKWHRGGDG